MWKVIGKILRELCTNLCDRILVLYHFAPQLVGSLIGYSTNLVDYTGRVWERVMEALNSAEKIEHGSIHWLALNHSPITGSSTVRTDYTGIYSTECTVLVDFTGIYSAECIVLVEHLVGVIGPLLLVFYRVECHEIHSVVYEAYQKCPVVSCTLIKNSVRCRFGVVTFETAVYMPCLIIYIKLQDLQSVIG